MDEYSFSEKELADLKEIFFTEAYEILQSLDQEILDLESGQDRSETLTNIQRHLHTLKGNSRALGFANLNAIAHRAEDLLRAIQDTSAETDKDIIDLLLAVNDGLQSSVDGYRSDGASAPDERLLERIESCLKALGGGVGADSPVGSKTGEGANLYDITVTLSEQGETISSGVGMILERIATLGEVVVVEPAAGSGLMESAGRFSVRLGSAESADAIKNFISVVPIVRDVEIVSHPACPRYNQERDKTTVDKPAPQTLRVDAQRLDKILNLVGELVIGRSMLGQVLSEVGERYKKDELVKRLGEANAFMEKTLSHLQKNVMNIRMLPISQVFRKFPRVVRDLAAEKGKQIELVMQGEKTELDKSILDVIGEPLIHLVRNAVDHGIELPDVREAAGKPRTGTVALRASHEGNQIVIEVMDDGKGLDPALLRKKSVEKGARTQDEAERLTDEEVLDLIFLSGFSTADVVTDVSGRGFGMDIVRTTVESLKGRIQVRSKPAEGSVVTLRLPLTLAIIRAMLFRVGSRLFALPVSSIEKIARIRDDDVQSMTGKSIIRHRDKVISLVSLDESLTIGKNGAGREKKRFVIIVGLAGKLYGFAVDRLVGQQELVIKSLENHWGTINCTAGASILGDGNVVLILDAPSIIMKETGREFVST